MYIFTIWNQSPISPGYVDCLDQLKSVYPGLVVEPIISPDGEDARIESDICRLKRLAEIDGDALYLDADCVPGAEIFDGAGLDKLSFANNIGGWLDTWAIYKPAGAENQVREFIETCPKERTLCAQTRHANRTRDKYGIICGYPDYKYFFHKYLGSSGNKQKQEAK